MKDRIRKLANDMMEEVNLHALIAGDLYADDVRFLMGRRKEGIGESFAPCGGARQAPVPGVPRRPEQIGPRDSADVSNLLCTLFFDNNPPLYRYRFANRTREAGYFNNAVHLSGIVNGRSRQKSYLLRVDCDSHSYVVYVRAARDEGYLFQANSSESMRGFTFREWMNSAKADRPLSIREHMNLLMQLQGRVVGMGFLKQRLVDTFSIDDDHLKVYEPFRGTDLFFCFREINERIVVENLRALYKRACVPVPAF